MRIALFTTLLILTLCALYPANAADRDFSKGARDRNASEHSQDDVYYDDIKSSIDDWISFEEMDGGEVIESDIILIEDENYTISVDLEPGFYVLSGLADERCTNISLQYMTDYGELPQDYESSGVYPYFSFAIVEPTTLDIEMELEFDSGHRQMKTWFGYLISLTAGTDEDSRYDYIETALGWYDDPYMLESAELIDSHIGHLTRSSDTETFEYDLDEGYYYVSGEGGLAMKSLTVYIYDEDGESLYEYEYEDKYPWAEFDIDEPQTITVEFIASNFETGFDEAYYCFVVVNPDERWSDYEGYDYSDSSGWDGYEGTLEDAAYSALDTLIAGAEKHGEEVVESWTEFMYLESEENGVSIDLDLDPGTYYVYVQGDGICLKDIFLTINDEDGDFVDECSSYPGAAICRIEVGRGGGSYEALVQAYWLDCYIGYFAFVLTQE